LLKYLSRRHSIYLLSLIKSESEMKSMEQLRPYCRAMESVLFPKMSSYWQCLIHLPTRVPLRVAYCRSPEVQRRIHKVLEEAAIDLIYVKRTRMAQHVESLCRVPRVLDLTDAVSLYYKRALHTIDPVRFPLYLEEYLRMRRHEAHIIHQFDLSIVCSPIDRDFLIANSRWGTGRLEVIPNGVDTEFYRPWGKSVEQQSLLFSGLMDRHVNIDAALFLARRVWPIVKREIPEAKLYIVGPKPSSSVRRLARDPHIVVTGLVPDLREYLEKSQVVLCPMRVGAGARNKILQAMAFRKAVVSTSLGLEGIEGVPGRDILIADQPGSFARSIIDLMRDEALRERIASNGERLLHAKYSMKRIVENLENRLSSLLCPK
jgi:sugar transferase (PEP-CTERM/EpsH1 system associated)